MNEEVPPVRTWLVKSEPTHYSIDALARDRSAGWEGVRNFQARNFMRDEMRQGELVLFAHSNADPSGIAGLAKVTGPVVPDPTQFDRRSEYFDAKSTRVAPRWHMVHLTFVERFAAVVSLEQLRREKGLAGMELLRKGSRLSVQPVERAHLALVLKLAHARTRLAP